VNRILLLPGDGIGPEVTREARRVLEAAAGRFDLKLEFEEGLIGGAAIDAEGTPLSDAVVETARQCRAVLMGAVGGPKWDALGVDVRPEKGLLRIRKELGLFANLRPARMVPALVGASSLKPEVVAGLDLLVVRELTGGIYFGEPRGRSEVAGRRSACNTMVYDEDEIVRISKVAFESARKRRGEVTHVHKANVLDVSQLWVEVVEEVAKEYSDVTLSHQLVDSMAMLLLRDSGCCPPRASVRAGSVCTNQCTARRPTSRARTRPIRSRRSCRLRCCSNILSTRSPRQRRCGTRSRRRSQMVTAPGIS